MVFAVDGASNLVDYGETNEVDGAGAPATGPDPLPVAQARGAVDTILVPSPESFDAAGAKQSVPVPPELATYMEQQPADVSEVPFGLEGLEYGSPPEGEIALIISEDQPHYVAAAVGTPPLVGELAEGGAANFLSPAWRAEIEVAVERNGGLGNSRDGFLAFSKDHGFVRLRNPGLSPEQNRRLAAISLQTGWAVENIPARTEDSAFEKENVNRWVNEFIGRFDDELSDFKLDPLKNEIDMKDGSRRRYVLQFNEDAGGFVSYYHRKSGGLKGFVQKNIKYIGPVLDGLSLAVNIIPGIGQAASAAIAVGAQALKTASSVIATGKLKAQQVVGAVASLFGPTKFFGALTKAQTAAVLGGANAGAQYIDEGKVSARAVAGAVTPLIGGLPGGTVTDNLVRSAVRIAAKEIDGGKITATDLFDALAPLVFKLEKGEAKDQLVALAQEIDGGTLSAADAAAGIAPLIDSLTGDDQVDAFLFNALELVTKSIDRGAVSARDAVEALVPFAVEQFGVDDDETSRDIFRALVLASDFLDTGEVEAKLAWALARDLLDLPDLQEFFGKKSNR